MEVPDRTPTLSGYASPGLGQTCVRLTANCDRTPTLNYGLRFMFDVMVDAIDVMEDAIDAMNDAIDAPSSAATPLPRVPQGSFGPVGSFRPVGSFSPAGSSPPASPLTMCSPTTTFSTSRRFDLLN